MNHDTQRELVLDLARRYARLAFSKKVFVPGSTDVPVTQKTFDEDEVATLVDSCLDFWLTAGRFAADFENDFAKRMGLRHCSLCNSGSSANLLAVSALCSPRLRERRLLPGDEVITPAAGFPTTINPIVQNGLVPVFIDVELGTYNPSPESIEAAIGPRTRAIIAAHALGNPLDLKQIRAIADAHDLFFIEDCCDAVGARSGGVGVGTVGDLATTSFYPAHHITMGEGGAVLTDSLLLRQVVDSLRDWGRDCWCPTGQDNTCGRRFDWELGDLPSGYDHKYIYSHIGYNLKITDMQAAIGVAQLKKLNSFIYQRQQNFRLLEQILADLDRYFILPVVSEHDEPSWFGFPLTIKESAPFRRRDIISYLNQKRIGNRMLFAGNVLRQPGYNNVSRRISGNLVNTNIIAENTFWVGVHPGLTAEMTTFVGDTIRQFVVSR